jgi:glycerol-3-phosphate acyltransferase PlsY
MLAPLAAVGALLVFIFVTIVWRYVSLGSVSSAAAIPLLMYFLWAPGHAPPLVVDFGTLFAAALVIFKHDANLQRLVDGEEPRFSFGKAKGDPT